MYKNQHVTIYSDIFVHNILHSCNVHCTNVLNDLYAHKHPICNFRINCKLDLVHMMFILWLWLSLSCFYRLIGDS